MDCISSPPLLSQPLPSRPAFSPYCTSRSQFFPLKQNKNQTTTKVGFFLDTLFHSSYHLCGVYFSEKLQKLRSMVYSLLSAPVTQLKLLLRELSWFCSLITKSNGLVSFLTPPASQNADHLLLFETTSFQISVPPLLLLNRAVLQGSILSLLLFLICTLLKITSTLTASITPPTLTSYESSAHFWQFSWLQTCTSLLHQDVTQVTQILQVQNQTSLPHKKTSSSPIHSGFTVIHFPRPDI